MIFSVLFIAILISKIFYLGKNNKEQYDKSYTWIIYMFSFQLLLFSFSFIIAGTIDFFLIAFGIARLNYVEHDAGDVVVSTLLIASWLLFLILLFIIIFRNRKKSEYSFFKSQKKSIAIAGLIQLLAPIIFIIVDRTIESDSPLTFASQPFEIKYKKNGEQYLINIDLKFIWTSKETAYLQKEDSLEMMLFIPFEFDSEPYPLSIDEWSDNNSEIMALKSGEVYWMHLSGAIDSSSYSSFTKSQNHRKEFIIARGNFNSLPGNLNNAIGKLYFNFEEFYFIETL